MTTKGLHDSIIRNTVIGYNIGSGEYFCILQIREIIYKMIIDSKASRTLDRVLETFYNTMIDNIANDFIISTLQNNEIKPIF